MTQIWSWCVPNTERALTQGTIKLQLQSIPGGESEEFLSFVTDLKQLVKDCGYADEDRTVRDAIVLRRYYVAVEEKYLDKSNKLMLQSVIKIGQSHETSQEGLKVNDERIEGDPKVSAVNERSPGEPNIQPTRRPRSHQKESYKAKEQDRGGIRSPCEDCGQFKSYWDAQNQQVVEKRECRRAQCEDADRHRY